jgi:hypothetical protein
MKPHILCIKCSKVSLPEANCMDEDREQALSSTSMLSISQIGVWCLLPSSTPMNKNKSKT